MHFLKLFTLVGLTQAIAAQGCTSPCQNCVNNKLYKCVDGNTISVRSSSTFRSFDDTY